jgi:hypothetical protein
LIELAPPIRLILLIRCHMSAAAAQPHATGG